MATDPRPDFWRCTHCGCLWRDNHDHTVSLGSATQTSCPECEMKPTVVACEPLFRAARPAPPDPPEEDDSSVVVLWDGAKVAVPARCTLQYLGMLDRGGLFFVEDRTLYINDQRVFDPREHDGSAEVTLANNDRLMSVPRGHF